MATHEPGPALENCPPAAELSPGFKAFQRHLQAGVVVQRLSSESGPATAKPLALLTGILRRRLSPDKGGFEQDNYTRSQPLTKPALFGG